MHTLVLIPFSQNLIMILNQVKVIFTIDWFSIEVLCFACGFYESNILLKIITARWMYILTDLRNVIKLVSMGPIY